MNFKIYILSMALVTVLLQGCHQGDRPEGHYEGALLQRLDTNVGQQPVNTDASYDQTGAGHFQVSTPDKKIILSIDLSQPNREGLQISIPSVLAGTQLHKEDSGCYGAKADRTVRFCFSSDKFLLEVMTSDNTALFTLSGDHFSQEAHFVMEPPATFSLADTVEVALKRNFNSRIEFEQVMQAKDRAKSAYLNLLPHLSFLSVLTSVTPCILGTLGAVGDLAPFLIPTRWFQAKEATLKSEAEADAMVLMQADLATEVEGLGYSFLRDQENLALYFKLTERAKLVFTLVENLENQNQMPDGSVDHIAALIDFMEIDSSGLALLLNEDKSVIAAALGFHNPEAVTDITLGSEIMPIEAATSIRQGDLADIVLSRSFELQQLDYLIQGAHEEKHALYFNWLDPAGDYNAELGFGLGATISVAQSQIEELLIKREQLQAQLVSKLYESVDEYNQALETYGLLTKSMSLNERRLGRVISQIIPGSVLNTLDVQSVFNDYLANGLLLATAHSSFRIARSKLDRLLLQGFYLNIPVREQKLMNL